MIQVAAGIETAKLNDVEPHRYLSDVLTRIARHPIKRIAELRPWNIANPPDRLETQDGVSRAHAPQAVGRLKPQAAASRASSIQAAGSYDKCPMLALRPTPQQGGQRAEGQPALRRQTRVASRSITVVRRPNGSGVTPRIQSSTRATSIVTNMALDRSGPSGK